MKRSRGFTIEQVMKIVRIETEGLRGVADGVYSFAHPHTGTPFDVSYVTGPIASGKTTLLRAIATAKEHAAGYAPSSDPRELLRPLASNGRLTLVLLLNDDERRLADLGDPVQQLQIRLSGARAEIEPRLGRLLRVYSHDASHGLITLLPANRHMRLPQWAAPEPPPDISAEARLCLSDDEDKYRALAPWLHQKLVGDASTTTARLRDGGLLSNSQAQNSLAPFSRGLAALCPDLRLRGLSENGEHVALVRRSGEIVALHELSRGELDAVLLAATHQRLGLNNSVVLIDRPALWTSYDDHVRWMAELMQLGEGNQVIAATTTPALLGNATAQQVVRLR